VTNILCLATLNVDSHGHVDCLSLLLQKKLAQSSLQHAPMTKSNGPVYWKFEKLDKFMGMFNGLAATCAKDVPTPGGTLCR
jgi:hypothetical protein